MNVSLALLRLASLRRITVKHGGINATPGIDVAMDFLSNGDVHGARSSWHTLLQKKGLLGDFYIDPTEDQDAALLNKELSASLDQICEDLDQI